MSQQAGQSLGPYEILASLGSGGMGEVYRARDTRLGREVAIKVLPDALASDPRALARFELEAKAVAALSHPSILALHDVGEANGVRYVVMELLQGGTLQEEIERGALEVRRALEIAGPVAEALAAAHEKGIVHRDVKPANIFLTHDGRVKLLDFGLAALRAVPGPANSAASPVVQSLTEAGAVVGTVAYMSPEQARGEPVDFRSDQFSLGVVLYEMLTGGRPFAHGSPVETLAAVIRDEPEPLELRAPHVPAPTRWLVGRLMAKEAGQRYASTRDVASELAVLRAHVSEMTLELRGSGRPRPRGGRIVLTALSFAVAGAALLGLLFVRERQRPRPIPGRFEIRLPDGYFLEPYRNSLALSPDGRLLVFSAFPWKLLRGDQGSPRLFLRPLDSSEARPMEGTEGGVQPVFSPDGLHVAFTVSSGEQKLLRRVPVAGGGAQTVCPCDAEFGAVWTPDGSILFASSDGPLRKVSATGGVPEPVTVLDVAAGEVSHRLPHLLPDGRTVLYTALRWANFGMTWERARIYSARPGEKGRSLLVEGGSDGRWVPPGFLLFGREGRLLAAPFDAKAGMTGQPRVVLDGVRHSIWTGNSALESGATQVSWAPGGVVAWGPGSATPAASPLCVRVDTSGRETPLEGGTTPGPVLSAHVSLDGQRILLGYNHPGLQAEVLDLARKVRRRVTFDVNPGWVIWGPGEDRITFTSDHEGPVGIYSRRLDAGPEEITPLWNPPDGSYVALGSWSRDGKVLAFVRTSEAGKEEIWLLEEGKEPRPFLATRFAEKYPEISPDGRWLLYTTDAPGRSEVFARALSGDGDTLPVSAGEGREPLWSPDGRAVYYLQSADGSRGARTIFRVRVSWERGAPAFGIPERLLAGSYLGASPGRGWDVGPDGRFLLSRPLDEEGDRAFWGAVLSDRILVDTGGVAHLLAGAKALQ